ncbi:MAG: hypothetical protein BMS9Abin37_1556 [Acidobacteriota bacterium]|nr:MAG: hypothetical protein BMS9Abin37_1556 [Acidobacteriota bacterium]
MSESPRSKGKDFLTGAAVGALAGLIIKDLDLTMVVSYWEQRSPLVLVAALVGAVSWLTSLRKSVALAVAALAVLWLAVAFTPLTGWMARDLLRRDPLQKADAVFVLASGLQTDGELSPSSMSRLVRGLELIGEGWASRLILTEHPKPYPRYRDAASELIASLGLDAEIIIVGPTRNTHDEAVAVSEVVRAHAFDRIIVVTAPSHTRRACAALEAEGVTVTCVPSQQIHFDFENLAEPFDADSHVRAFGPVLHERVGLVYYNLRRWIE